MRCSEIMKRDVEWISENDLVNEAARRMRDHDVGILPVCDVRRRVVGVVTDRDLALRVCAEGRSATTTLVRVRRKGRFRRSSLGLKSRSK